MSHGLLFIDKTTGPTSHDVVNRARRILSIKSIGHAGTLDPLATGLMVLLVGEATKLSDLLLNGDKGYEVKVRFGLETDSWDITGEVKKEQPVDLNPDDIRTAVENLMGEHELSVPSFSAVKVDGKRLYKEARKGADVVAPVRKMNFYDGQILEMTSSSVRVSLKCGKGGFIRSWAHTLGQRLGTCGTVEELRRTWSAPFSVEQAITLEGLEKRVDELRLELPQPEPVGKYPPQVALYGQLNESFIPQSKALPHVKGVTVRGKDERLMGHGQIPNDLSRRLIYEQKIAIKEGLDVPIKVLSGDTGELIAILQAQPSRGLKIKRIFKNP